MVGNVAVALLSGLKLKFAPLKEVFGLELELSGKEVVEAARSTRKDRSDGEQAGTDPLPADGGGREGRLAERESLYFNVRSRLMKLTGPGCALRIVVLVDDLDRCLPEKAIQVLESVKLFLNVPGFSFVLAIDDEVVERGIMHRYGAYAQRSAAGDPAGMPITGAEYLEKIVHLPVHLQRWTEDEAERFLRDNYPRQFGPAALSARAGRATGLGPGEVPPAPTPEAALARFEDELLRLVTHAVPLVPRKLIRLAEALEYARDRFQESGAIAVWHPLHAARLTALQQLYPGLYRHVRLRSTRYWRLFELGRNQFGEPAVEGGGSLHELEQDFETKAVPAAEGSRADEEEIRSGRDTLREQLDLLRLVELAGRQRGAPDPLALFRLPKGSPERQPTSVGVWVRYEQFARLYIHGLAPPRGAGVAATTGEQVAAVVDPERLLAVLASADLVARREYLETTQLRGRLPDELFARLLARLGREAPLPTEISWLSDLAGITGEEQLLRIYVQFPVLQTLAKRADGVAPQESVAEVPG